MKITPAHDFNDYEVGQRHDLPMINIFTVDAHLNDAVPAAYRGLDRTVARKRIVDDLTAAGLIDKIEPHKLMVPRGDRSDAVIEPLLTDQWFVAIDSLAKPAIEAVQRGDIEFVPKQYENLYFAWMREIRDWTHQPATMVGTPDSGLVRRKRRDLRRARRSRSAAQIQTLRRCRADG